MNTQLDGSTAEYRATYERVVVMTITSALLALGLAAFVIRKIVLEMR